MVQPLNRRAAVTGERSVRVWSGPVRVTSSTIVAVAAATAMLATPVSPAAIAAPPVPATPPSAPAPTTAERVSDPMPEGAVALDVSFESLDAGVLLAGTLLLPDPATFGVGPYPTVVLISGSGPQDRDSTIVGHKPFRAIAGALAAGGVATLRFDDRGVGGSADVEPEVLTASTIEDVADDAAGALAFLRTHPDVDRARLGVLGHSEGGAAVAALMRREQCPGPAVLLAGTTIPGRQVFLDQIPASIRAQGGDDAAVAEASAGAIKIVDGILNDDEAEVLDGLVDVVYQQIAGQMSKEMLRGQLAQQARMMNGPGMRYFFAYDPGRDLAKATHPVLALFGELDQQVLPADNAPVARGLLEAWPAHSAVEVIPGANHLFLPAATGAMTEYPTIRASMMPEVLDRLRTWYAARFGIAADVAAAPATDPAGGDEADADAAPIEVAAGPGVPNPNREAAPDWWFTEDLDQWRGRPWTEFDLFRFMERLPAVPETGTHVVIFFSRTCDHCESMIRDDLRDPAVAEGVTLVEIPHSVTERRSPDAWPMPDVASPVLDLPLGTDWIVTAPLAVRIEDGRITCIEEGDHAGCLRR